MPLPSSHRRSPSPPPHCSLLFGLLMAGAAAQASSRVFSHCSFTCRVGGAPPWLAVVTKPLWPSRSRRPSSLSPPLALSMNVGPSRTLYTPWTSPTIPPMRRPGLRLSTLAFVGPICRLQPWLSVSSSLCPPMIWGFLAYTAALGCGPSLVAGLLSHQYPPRVARGGHSP